MGYSGRAMIRGVGSSPYTTDVRHGHELDRNALERYLASERGRRAIRASLRRSLVVERLVDEWLDAHPDAWPTWGPARPSTPAGE